MKQYQMPENLDRQFYTKAAKPNRHQARRLRMVKRLLHGCGGRALDYGCGYGDITYAIAGQFPGIVGTDVSPERIAWARKEFHPVPFQVCREAGLDFGDAAFQTVISIVVINWVDDPDRYLAEIYRVLAPGGKLVVAAAGPDRLREGLRKVLGQREAQPRYWQETRAQMLARLERHGFAIEQADCFFDPIRDNCSSWRTFILELIRLPLRVLRPTAVACYYGFRAVKR